MTIADRVLHIAQSEAPQFGFWEVDAESWPCETRPKRVLVTVGDKYDDEIEVVVDEDADDDEIVKQIWKEIEGRAQAAADVASERSAERSALACDR